MIRSSSVALLNCNITLPRFTELIIMGHKFIVIVLNLHLLYSMKAQPRTTGFSLWFFFNSESERTILFLAFTGE